MKKPLFLLFILLPIFSFSTIHIVEAGGSQTITPYYNPQFFEIEVGDTVIWDVVTGTHNVTTISGPESISSGDLESPTTFQHVFTIAGIYDYECTLWDHADTQFGTITVTPASTVGLNESELLETQISLFPIPATATINISSEILEIQETYIYDQSGKKVASNSSSNTIDVKHINSGFYYMHIVTNKGIVRKKFLIK